MQDEDRPSTPPLLVLVRDSASGWAHVARPSPASRATPIFVGFLHTDSEAELFAAMAAGGYQPSGRYDSDGITTTYWFSPVHPSAPDGRPMPESIVEVAA